MADIVGIPFDAVQQVCLSPLAYTKGTDFKPAERPTPTRSSTGTPGSRGRAAAGRRPGGHGLHAARRGRRAVRRRLPRPPPPCRAHRCSRWARTAGGRRCGSAPRRARRAPCVFAVDHHRGSEENQAGWDVARPVARRRRARGDGHPADASAARSSTAGLEDVVVAVVGPVARRRRALAHAAGAVLHRRRPRRRAGPRRLRRLDAPRGARRARWPSTTCSPIRPTAAARPTRTSTCRRWPVAASPRCRRRGSLRVLRRA